VKLPECAGGSTPQGRRRAIAATGVAIAMLVTAVFESALAAAQNPISGTSGIVTFGIVNYDSHESNLPVTFGSVFARGDLPREGGIEAVDSHGAILPMQLDRKASHPDGSLRHAIVTLVIPHLAKGEEVPVAIRRAGSASSSEKKAITVADLPPDFDFEVILNSGNRRLKASARTLLAGGKADTWLSGPLVSEWWVAGPFRNEGGTPDPHLAVRFGIRCYGRDHPLRLEVVVENDWTFVPHPRTEFYDARIQMGGKTVFTKSGIVQPSQTRWRKGFWWGEPISLYVKQNLDYLKKASVVPNYAPDLRVSDAALTRQYRRFEESDRSPMAAGIITKYMPMTGGRPDIGPLPQWQAMYLLTMDPRAYEMVLQTADLGASFRSHYRDEKTGRPATIAEHPNLSVNENLVGRTGQPETSDKGSYKDPLVPDTSHQPALDFIPYLITGDRFYLEELQFWSQWNVMVTAPGYHGYGAGLISWGQVRSQAWSLRTLAQAAYITPDSDPLKATLEHQLKANIGWYETHLVHDAANKIGTAFESYKPTPFDNGRSIAPWQDDFFTWSVSYVQSLGDIDVRPLLRWKAQFPIGRMVAPGFCWILATPYTMIVRDSVTAPFYPTFADIYAATIRLKAPTVPDATKLECGSQAMADALKQEKVDKAGEMVNGSRAFDGYPSIMQAALAAAVDSGAPGAKEAWVVFQTRSVKPDYADGPGWDIVPWRTNNAAER
jgi:hypothetical protein